MGPGGRLGWGPAFPFVSIRIPVMKFSQYCTQPYLNEVRGSLCGSRTHALQAGRRRGDEGVGDAGGIEPVCTDAPDGARPRGERKDALDTVA